MTFECMANTPDFKVTELLYRPRCLDVLYAQLTRDAFVIAKFFVSV